MIKNAIYISVWDGGYEVTTNCKVDTETKEIFDIEMAVGVEDFVEELDYEYITIDGENYPVYSGSDDRYYEELKM